MFTPRCSIFRATFSVNCTSEATHHKELVSDYDLQDAIRKEEALLMANHLKWFDRKVLELYLEGWSMAEVAQVWRLRRRVLQVHPKAKRNSAMLFVSAQKKADRLAICQACEHYVVNTKSWSLVTEAFTNSKLCGCYMPAKAKLKRRPAPLESGTHTSSRRTSSSVVFLIGTTLRGRRRNSPTSYLSSSIQQEASSCPPCNRQLLRDLKKIVDSADS